MSTGTVVKIRRGKQNTSAMYVQLKNKAVYRYSTPLLPAAQTSLAKRIRDNANKVRLTHWVKVA